MSKSQLGRPASHQTVRLGRGRHVAPGSKVCVMELSSMLGGEAFSDHPRSVCPVLAALLRAYNDRVDDSRRQALYPLASLAVATRRGRDVEERRAKALQAWCADRDQRRAMWRRLVWPISLDSRLERFDAHAHAAMRCLPRPISDRTHAEFVALVDSLVAIGEAEPRPKAAPRMAPRTSSAAVADRTNRAFARASRV